MSSTADLPAAAKIRVKPPYRFSGKVMAQGSSTLAWYVPNSAINAFVAVVCGNVSLSGGPGGLITRIVPMSHPYFTYMIADDIDGEAIGWDQTTNFYSAWNVSVTFRTPNFDLFGANAFLTVGGRPSARAIGATSGVGSFPSDGAHTLHDPGYFVPGMTYGLTDHWLGTTNEGLWVSLQKSVNNAPFRGMPVGTVLYNGPTFVRQNNFLGTTIYEVTHEFETSAIPWNQELRSDGTLENWQINSILRYPLSDLTQLLI